MGHSLIRWDGGTGLIARRRAAERQVREQAETTESRVVAGDYLTQLSLDRLKQLDSLITRAANEQGSGRLEMYSSRLMDGYAEGCGAAIMKYMKQ